MLSFFKKLFHVARVAKKIKEADRDAAERKTLIEGMTAWQLKRYELAGRPEAIGAVRTIAKLTKSEYASGFQ